MGLFKQADFSQGCVPDPRLDPFRDRAARATLPDGRCGIIFVESDCLATHEAGHLWWRRWSQPYEMATLWLDLPDGLCTDIWLSDDEAIESETAEWAQGIWRGPAHHGHPAATYRLEWLGAEESRRIGQEFGAPEPRA